MLLFNAVAVFYFLHLVSAIPLDFSFQRKRDVNSTLVPSFGWQAGINPDGTGNCDGAVNGTNGKPIQVPCQCPPNSTFFLAALNQNVAAGFVTTNPSVKLTFPTDNSTASQLARLNAAAVTLQNLEGPGIGCPVSSTTFSAQQKAIEAEASTATSSAATPSSPSSAPAISPTPVTTSANQTSLGGGSCTAPTSTASAVPTPSTPPPTTSLTPLPSSSPTNTTVGLSSVNATSPTDAQIAALAPPLGWQSGINPDGTGNCDGAVNGTNGQPILIPCQCPPDQTNYIANLTANIRAGHVVLNPSVLVTFPTDNSTASQSARLNAAAVTIQNLNGAGKGCPVASTTFSAQQKAINAEGSG